MKRQRRGTREKMPDAFPDRRSALALFALAAAGALAAVILFEALYPYVTSETIHRSSGTIQPIKRYARLREHLPFTNISVTPSDEYLKETDSLEKKPYRFSVDRDGFIEPSSVHATPQIKIVFLGGSSTECFYVSPEERFPYRGGRLLERQLGMSVNSYNGGVSGNHSMHANVLLAAKVLPMKPQVVVLMEAMNDFGTLLLTGSYWNDNPYRSMIVQEPPQRSGSRWHEFTRGLRSVVRSALPSTSSVLSQAWRRLFHQESATADEFAAIRGVVLKPRLEPMLNEYAASIRTFVRTARAFGIEPVLMTQAHRLTANPDPAIKLAFSKLERDNGVDYETYRGILLEFNDAMRKVAEHEQVTLIDLERLIPQNREFIYDSVHYNATGSRRAAEIIATRLAEVIGRR